MRRQFYYEKGNSTIRIKKLNYEKEILFWKNILVWVYNQTEVLLCIEISIGENNSIIRSSQRFFGKEEVLS